MRNITFLFGFLLALYRVSAECNGSPSLCEQAYNNITYLVTHDSYALTPNLAGAQDDPILQQLSDGVRGIKLSAVAPKSSKVHLCHTACRILDAGPATNTLNDIAGWLKENPKEVVTIMWNNLYNYPASKIAEAYEESDIMPLVYTHNTSGPWPTIQQMIDSGKRVVNFIDAEANENRYPWLMDQFSRVFETPYDITNTKDFGCDIDRISHDANPSNLMYLLNHFLYGVIDIASIKIEMPSRIHAFETNSQSLVDHTVRCSRVFKRKPNFIEVDYYSSGQALTLIKALNGIEDVSDHKKKNTRDLFQKIAQLSQGSRNSERSNKRM
ncbi:PLC-like phosphodiesterase [Backusella circina FSU 941]|nr:PLC-like phosphodiesterase [Backusella circina FSU 941]